MEAEPTIRKRNLSLSIPQENTEVKIEGLLENTNKRIESLNNTTPAPATATPNKDTTTSKKPVDTKNPTKTTDTKEPVVQKKSALSGTEKPIAYVELFLLNVASFIFKSAIAFYLVCAFLLFIIIRFIYKKIKG